MTARGCSENSTSKREYTQSAFLSDVPQLAKSNGLYASLFRYAKKQYEIGTGVIVREIWLYVKKKAIVGSDLPRLIVKE